MSGFQPCYNYQSVDVAKSGFSFLSNSRILAAFAIWSVVLLIGLLFFAWVFFYSLPTLVKWTSPLHNSATVPFNSEQWKRTKSTDPKKLAMTKQIVLNHMFMGELAPEVEKQLGSPDSEVEVVYLNDGVLHAHALKYSVHPGDLYLIQDENYRVVRVEFSQANGTYL